MMMGQSATVATAFAAAIFLIGIIITVQTSLSSIQSISTTITEQVSKSELILTERCRTDTWEILDPTTIKLYVTNIGEVSLRAKEFYQMEIFVHYISSYNDPMNGYDRFVRFEFSNTQPVGEYWNLVNIYYNGLQGEKINPINILDNTGLWDPYETIEINIHLIEDLTSIEYVTFVLPTGYTSSLGSSQNEFGSAIIEAGNTSVVVPHNFNQINKNIQVTPTSYIQTTYWVTSTDNASFSINIRESWTEPITFYWRATP
jgi:hypothetical protein